MNVSEIFNGLVIRLFLVFDRVLKGNLESPVTEQSCSSNFIFFVLFFEASLL